MHFAILRRLFIEWHIKVPKLIDVYKVYNNKLTLDDGDGNNDEESRIVGTAGASS